MFRIENVRRPPIQRARYEQALEISGRDTAAMKEPAYVSRRYSKLKSEHTATGTYLKRIKKAETNRCWECNI